MSRVRRSWTIFFTSVSLASGLSPAPAQVPAVQITAFHPREASFLGKTPFEIRGQGFTPSTRVLIDNKAVSVTFVDATKLAGMLSPHAETASPVPVTVDDASAGSDTLDDGVTFVGPYRAASVRPGLLRAASGGQIVITGTGFTPESAVAIGGSSLQKSAIRYIDTRTLEVMAPAMAPGRYDVRVFEPAVLVPGPSSTLEGGLGYARELFPGPQEVETSLAEGTARFSWHNPVEYDEIEVLDANGAVIRRLDGSATSLELPTGSAERLDIGLRGVLDSGDPSRLTDAIAKLLFCSPQPLAGNGTPGEIDLSLRGGHDPAEVERCAPDLAGPDGAGAHAGSGIGIDDLGSRGFPIPRGLPGRLKPCWLLDFFPDPNSLVTGFLLEEEATVLDFSAFYQKVAVFPGVELRGRIVQVASPTAPELEDGFTDEFTFPGTTLAGKKEWHSVTYFRADKDVGYIPDPDDPNDQPAKPCLDEQGEVRKIPAGEYLLELYAVGGNPQEQYFTFADDSRDFELLIPNAPCPPYPLVKVTNMTGRYTLPVLTTMTADVDSVSPGGKPVVDLRVEGSWLDEDAMPQPIGQGHGDNPDFEYVWTIYDRGGNPRKVSSGSASFTTAEFQDWGCYYIDVTVKDRACPRSRTQSFQVAVAPAEVACTPGNDYFSFLFPTPEPSGICGIVGLDPPPGLGQMANQRPIEFRVLIAPKYHCMGLSGPAAFIGDVEFTLTLPKLVMVPGEGLRFVFTPIPGVELEVMDLCPDVSEGLKYFHVKIVDVGALPDIMGAGGGEFLSVYFAGKSSFFYDGSGQRFEVSPGDEWHSIGPPMRLTNHPPALERSFWTGTYDDKADTYYFSMQAGSSSRQGFPIGPSKEVPLPIEGAPTEISIPSYDNDVTTGFNPIFKMHQEEFEAVDGVGGTFGECFGNQVEGAAVVIEPTVTQSAALGGPGSFPTYEWEECRTIFSNELSETLFESILYTGSIGPVPVTVWASIGLGIDFLMQARTHVKLNPFAAVEGGHYLESDAALFTRVGVNVPCEIRADVLFGVASIAARLIPEAEVELKAHAGVVDTDPAVGAFMGAYLSLFFEIEACIWALVDEICYSPGRVPILDREELVSWDFGDGAPNVSECEDSSALVPLMADGGGAGILDPTYKLAGTSRPGVGVSPSGSTTLYAVAVEAPEGSFGDTRTLGTFFIEGQQVFNVGNAIHDGIDPAVSFLSNSSAMVAWTRGGIPDGVIPVFDEIDRRNIIAAHQDILLTVHRASTSWIPSGSASYVLVSDRPEEVPSSQKQADGMATMSADLSAAAQQAGGEALVAWVRYEGPFLVGDSEKTRIYRQDPLSEKPNFRAHDVDTIRPNLENTSIFARRMGPSGPLGPAVRISPAGPGIDVEPTISVSPSGATAYCVWVRVTNHPDTGLQQTNMIDSNLGRNLAYAVYTKSGGTWGPPQTIGTVLPEGFPGMLEPSIALKDDDDGLLAFTALRPGSPEIDSGLANSRYVYAARLVNGVFQEPVLIHGKCLLPEVGHWPQVAWAAPIQPFDVGDGSTVNVASADFVLTYLGTGAAGTRSGAGNVMVTALGGDTWTAPRSLTLDDNVHSNMIAAVSSTGSLKTLHFDGGPARVIPGLGRAAGLAGAPRTLDARATLLIPDAAIVACRVSDAFAAPGSRVTASVEIENLGLASTPRDSGGASVPAVQAVYVDDLGRERKVARETVPVLAPGETATIDLALEVPHEPVLLRVILDPNPVDMDSSNDSRESFLGAPTPMSLECSFDFQVKGLAGDGSAILRAVARLSWSNPALYDAIRVYRDGSMLAELAGDATDFVDAYAAPGNRVYEVRGLLGVSKSRRARCEVKLPDEPPAGGFRRGDADSSGDLSITDGIVVLGYLFLGSGEPPCLDSADADDDGEIVITDAIAILGYLFLGSAAPPAPGPDACGGDPTADALSFCGSTCP